jgi:hypothetical protein
MIRPSSVRSLWNKSDIVREFQGALRRLSSCVGTFSLSDSSELELEEWFKENPTLEGRER